MTHEEVANAEGKMNAAKRAVQYHEEQAEVERHFLEKWRQHLIQHHVSKLAELDITAEEIEQALVEARLRS